MIRIAILARLAAAALICLSAGACVYPDTTTPYELVDYRAHYPIGVKSQVVESDFYGNAEGGLTTDEQRVLRQFVAAYMQRGRRPITVTTGGSGQSGQALAATLRQAALGQGLAAGEVVVGVDPSQPADRVRMSFVSYTAVVPECGYWSDESVANPDNVDSQNYGCSSQHNLGLMLADPSDLLGDTTMTARNATRSVTGTALYQAGQDPSGVWPSGASNAPLDTAH
jgi:pilus assembly protein CpaD